MPQKCIIKIKGIGEQKAGGGGEVLVGYNVVLYSKF